MPDFFDRLLARSMPMDAPFESVAGAVPARVRIPARFERVAPVAEPQEPWVPGAPAVREQEPPAPAIERVTRWMPQPAMPVPPAPPTSGPGQPVPVPGRMATPDFEHALETVAPQRESGPRQAEPGSPAPVVIQHTREVLAPTVTHVSVVGQPPLLVPPEAMPAPAPPGVVSARRTGATSVERTVHVRIGRIEVTASGPAQPDPRPRPQRVGPTLSLERYLGGEAAERGTR
jgi:hypothetical protein